MTTLTQEQFKALALAIEKSFNQNELTSLLERELGLSLASLVGLPMEWGPLVTQVVRRSQMEEFELGLALAVAAWRPRNVVLAKVLRELTQAPGAEATLALSPSARGTMLTKESALQGLVRTAADWANYESFLANLALAGPRVCRIEAGEDAQVFGTGFLVGDDLVLTNFHVRELLLHAGSTAACRFDYRSLAGSQVVRSGHVVAAAEGADAWMAWRPYAGSDVADGDTPPTAQELDYALLRLAEPVGRFPPGQDSAVDPTQARGHYRLSATAAPMTPGADMIVVQHPAGAPLKLAIGQVLSHPVPAAAAFRTAHDAPTEGGTSGSPCLDIHLALRALHHATDPQNPDRPRYNQAVPIGLIAADLVAKGKLQ